MSLIKCNECGKEISDKSQTCIHCGCPIEKELVCIECGNKINRTDNVCKKCGCPINNKIKNKKVGKIFTIIWLIICILTCLMISIINFANILNLDISIIQIANLKINVMGILALLLGGTYVFLLITFSKKSLYLLFIINALILIYNVLSVGMVISLFYIVLVLINSLITFLIMRKQLKKEKLKIKQFIPLFITLILCIIITIITSKLNNNYDVDIDIETEDTRTPKEKVIDYISNSKTYNVSSCNEYTCSFSSSSYGLTIYYKYNFLDNKYSTTSYLSGTSYVEYDYKNNTGYAKLEDNIGWTTILEVYVTFDEKNFEYKSTYKSSGYNGADVSNLVQNVADMIVDLRSDVMNMCNELNINKEDLTI